MAKKLDNEAAVKEQIKEFLATFGPDVWYYMPVQTGYGKPTLDFAVCFYGLFIWLEAKSLKTEHGRAGLTARQKLTQKETLRARGIVLEINEDTMGDCFMYLTELAAGRK